MSELNKLDLKKIHKDKLIALRRNEIKFEIENTIDLTQKSGFVSMNEIICKLKTRGDVKKLGENTNEKFNRNRDINKEI